MNIHICFRYFDIHVIARDFSNFFDDFEKYINNHFLKDFMINISCSNHSNLFVEEKKNVEYVIYK